MSANLAESSYWKEGGGTSVVISYHRQRHQASCLPSCMPFQCNFYTQFQQCCICLLKIPDSCYPFLLLLILKCFTFLWKTAYPKLATLPPSVNPKLSTDHVTFASFPSFHVTSQLIKPEVSHADGQADRSRSVKTHEFGSRLLNFFYVFERCTKWIIFVRRRIVHAVVLEKRRVKSRRRN